VTALVKISLTNLD